MRTGDRGIGKHGERKPGFEPGVDIRAKVTILADGVRGNLTKAVVRRLALDAGRQPQLYALGIKELWDVPADRVAPGTVIHTLGYPLRMEEFGGGFIYSMPEGRLAVGLRHRSGLQGSDVRSARPRSSISSGIRSSPGCWPAGRWCATARRRCPKAGGTPSRASMPAGC